MGTKTGHKKPASKRETCRAMSDDEYDERP